MASGNRLSHYSAGLYDFLGHRICKFSIVTSALLASISLFYIYTLGSHLQVIVYYFLNRYTYIKPFDDYLVSRYFDSTIISTLTLVWLAISLNGKLTKIFVSSIYGILLAVAIIANLSSLLSIIELTTLPLIVFLVLCNRYKRTRQNARLVRFNDLNLITNYFVIIAIALGIFSILISLSVTLDFQNFSVENIFTTKRIPVDNYGYEVFVLFSTLSPLLLIVIFFGFSTSFLRKAIFRRILRSDRKSWFQTFELESSEELHCKKSRAAYLLLFALLSVSLVIIPHLWTVNEENQQIGSDSNSYVQWINILHQKTNLQDFLKTAFIDLMKGDRPLSLIFLFLFTLVTEAPLVDEIEYAPIVLGPALVLVVYFFTRELTSNETSALFAASLTGLGYFQVSTGIFAGFYANWIALSVGYLSLIFFFRFLRSSNRRKSLLAFFLLHLAMLFSHAYTWSVFTIVIGIFLIVSILLKIYPRGKIILLALVVASSLAIDITKTAMVESFGSAGGVKLTLSLAQSSIGLKDPALVWKTVVDATQHHFGGIFSNIIIIGLTIYWLIRSDLRRDFNIFIMIFLIIGVPLIFLGDWVVQSRVFYNIPFQIPAAIAMTYISRQKRAPKVLLPVYVWLVAISIWTVSNFYEVKPS